MHTTFLRKLALVGCAALLVTACGDDDDDAGSSSTRVGSVATTSAGSSTTTGAGRETAYPVTISTKFGDVTLDEAPERVVALGWGDAETALALGVQPVGASDWLGFGGEGVGPWATGLYDEAPEIIETLEPSFEAVAALEPDLILDVRGSGDQERYERLSSIAPTIGVPDGGDSYLTSQVQQVTMIAAALGHPAEGAAQLAALKTSAADAAAAHPEWKGKTVTAATKTSEGWGAYIEGGGRVEFLEALGFVQSPTIAGLPVSANGFSVDISSERLDLLDADLMLAFPLFIDTKALTDDPLWQKVPAVAAGRSVVIDGDISAAYSLNTTLATQYAIDQLVPMIEDALGS